MALTPRITQLMEAKILFQTQSICPECFVRIPAAHVLENNTVYMEKICDVHGCFRAKIWQGAESYQQWVKPKIPILNRFHMVPEKNGCPFDCGLCPHHTQHTCTAVLEVTRNCNFNCRFCFADADATATVKDLSLGHIFSLLASVYEISPECNLQISGGEPTLRTDLVRIISRARKIGFKFIQLNTNGFLLATTASLAKTLRDAGLSSVFLQFDGVTDKVYNRLRRRDLFADKQRAISRCIENDIGVILVPTLVPGVNLNEIGPILFFALENAPGVRGVHFQPVSYFGRHRSIPADTDRITIPEILSEIESQTRSIFRQKDFRPSACEHALCSFNGKFLIMEDGTLKPLVSFNTDCCAPIPSEKGSSRATASVARQWGAPGKSAPPESLRNKDGLDKFIRRSHTHMFSVSGMAFQDVWNLDLERLKGCCIHSVAPDGRLVPFCAYNLTGEQGKRLYRIP